MNAGDRATEFFPDLLLIGSDGGGEAFEIDRTTGRFVLTPFIGDERSVRVDPARHSPSFFEFLARAAPVG